MRSRLALLALLVAAALAIGACGADERTTARDPATEERVDGMDDDRFWQLVEGAATPEALHEALAALDDDELAAFERAWEARFAEAFRWEVWGAAYVINGGCSDDCFDYFRAYLLSRGCIRRG